MHPESFYHPPPPHFSVIPCNVGAHLSYLEELVPDDNYTNSSVVVVVPIYIDAATFVICFLCRIISFVFVASFSVVPLYLLHFPPYVDVVLIPLSPV